MKPNEGEVPQYYVTGSHPAIIEPDEWEQVQAEFARRKTLGKAYSGKSVLSAKLVCEDCGAFFGPKVWHSTDQYRRSATANLQTKNAATLLWWTPKPYSSFS